MGRTGAAAVALALAWPALGQYPGQVQTAAKDAPVLRAVAVLEWTGSEQHPKASRLIPVSIYDGQQLQDAGIYMARPAPLALLGDVEYQLKQDGKTVGLFDLNGASQVQGSWVGMGKWKPLPVAKPAELAKVQVDDTGDDGPILHRKYHADDPKGSGSTGNAKPKAPPPDPDRPRLTEPDASASNTGDSAPAPDPDRPRLSEPADESGKPHLGKKKTLDVGYVESLPNITDPNRPRLIPGKPTQEEPDVLPALVGLPHEMNQMVAVSDAVNRPDHLWNFSWANPADELKMKADMEQMARDALGLTPPPAAAAPKKKTGRKRAGVQQLTLPQEPAKLEDEQFRVFELTYGGGATMVLSAKALGTAMEEKYVTLIAQPDLYGNVVVLLKNVTDTAHLDVTPRMKLVDPVDALADNRGELLFELRGATQREFALYRVVRGQADRIFITGPTYFGPALAN